MICEEHIDDIIENVSLFPAAEVQMIVGEQAYCIYRKLTRNESYAYYIADADEMEGPSGRKRVTRLSWNRRPQNSEEFPVARFAEELSDALDEWADVSEARLLNIHREFQREIDVADLGL